eukprot:m.98897 g.98897  ORF g.98897 m.98897 type:complete len:437 (-) comp15566_c0_seq5:304-1614(-)
MAGLPFGMREGTRAGSKREGVPAEFLSRLREKEAEASSRTATAAATTAGSAASAAGSAAPVVAAAPPAPPASVPVPTPAPAPAPLVSPAPPAPQAPATAFAGTFAALRSSEFYQPPAAVTTPADGGTGTGAQPPPPASGSGSGNAILVNKNQLNNPLLDKIKNVRYETGLNLVPDFQIGDSTCVLYLSLKFHKRYPEYIQGRIRELGRQYRLRVLLVQNDRSDEQTSLLELTKLSVIYDLTMLVAWSLDEAARYLETFQVYQHKHLDQLMAAQKPDDPLSCLTSIRSVSRTDVVTLMSTFCSLRGIIEAEPEEMRLCPGLGDTKVESLVAVFNEPFVKPGRRKPSRFRLHPLANLSAGTDAAGSSTPPPDTAVVGGGGSDVSAAAATAAAVVGASRASTTTPPPTAFFDSSRMRPSSSASVTSATEDGGGGAENDI